MKDRIREIMESQHMTQQTFANFIQTSPASLSSIFNGRTKPTLNIVEAIRSKIPNININWLLFGEGKMYMDNSSVSQPESHGEGEAVLDFGIDSPEETQQPNLSSIPLQPVRNNRQEPIKTEIKYIDKPQRKITEIRVYFDDLTYESFEPKK